MMGLSRGNARRETVFQRKTGDIARAHRFPVPLSDQTMAARDSAVLLRYDGKQIDGENIMFVAMPAADLAKIPEPGLGLTEADIDGETIFFRETASGVYLYLEAESQAERLKALREMAAAGEVRLIDCIGDLKVMGAPEDLQAPEFAAFEQNGFAEVSPRASMALLSDLKAEHKRATSANEDPSVSASF